MNRELQQALDDCGAALRIASDVDILNNRGLVNLKRFAFDKAREDYAAPVATKPTDADSLYGRGLAERGLGDASAAAADMATAIAVNPNIADIYALYFRNPRTVTSGQET